MKKLFAYLKSPQGNYLRAMFIQRALGICLFLIGSRGRINVSLAIYFAIYLLGTFISFLCFFLPLTPKKSLLKLGLPTPTGTRRILFAIQIWLGCFVVYFIAGLEAHTALQPMSIIHYRVGMILVIFSCLFSMYCTHVDILRTKDNLAIGPYKIIRFPNNTSQILWLIGTAFVFSTPWTILIILIDVIVLIVLTDMEDRILQESQESYGSYASQVRRKLFPIVW